ncbi:fibronectin type III domain-containing protein [Candidatus Saccharibacteria bacterium]|nr:fibronectin type III domain-containing protein [Candidatus Saccharibacteria bacterium]
MVGQGISLRRSYLFVILTGIFLATFFVVTPRSASAAACTAPSTDYGTVSNLTMSIPSTGTYRIWTRMAAPNATDNTYKLEIDGTTCYTVGGSTVPTYASGATTYFTSGSTNWISKTSGGAQIDVSLTSGNHTLKLIGNAPNVVVDRLIATQDTACVPTGTGDNCANPPDTTNPVVSITSPANNATISSTTTVTANATDDTAVTKVEFYVDGTLKATDTSSPYTYSFNPASNSVGSHQLTAKAYDAASNTATSSVVNVTIPDTTPPVISSISSGSITQTSATITWTTDEAADSQIKYGTTSSYGSTTTLNTTKVTSHSVSVTGLTAGTTYHYQVVSKDAAGNSSSSADQTFTTQAPAADTTAPTVSMTAPSNSSTVTGTVNVTASASDNVGVAGVQFKLDGNNLGTEDTSSPYSVSWNTTGTSNGSHTLTAVARDAAGNTKTATTITVTVNNPTSDPADINQDGSVNLLDFSLLASKFGQSGSGLGRADINQDGSVNLLDFSLLAGKFGT